MVSWNEVIIWSTAGLVGLAGLAVKSKWLQGYLKLFFENASEGTEVSEAVFSGGRVRRFDGFHGNPREGGEKMIDTIISYIDSAQKSIYLAMNICKIY